MGLIRSVTGGSGVKGLKMVVSRNILIFNVTPIYSNETDFIFFLSVNLGPQKRLWQSEQEGNLWADAGRRGACWPGNPAGGRERKFFWNNPFYTG